MNKPKNLFINLLIFAVSLVVSVVLFEAALKVILPVYDPRGMLDYKYYPEDGLLLCIKNFSGHQWKNTGDYNVAVRINKYGFRDKKDLLFSTPDDIFVLGDSFGLGWGVEEDKRYSDLLESILGVAVYNISIPTGNLNDYQKLLNYAQKKGAKIRNIIVAVCMENDLMNYELLSQSQYRLNRNFKGKKKYRLSHIFYNTFAMAKTWLTKNSAIYHAFASIMHRNNTLKRMAIKLGLIIDNYAGMRKNIYSDKILVSTSRKLLELSKPFNATVVIIPSRALWVGQNQKIELEVHNKLVSLLKELKMNTIDLRPYFEEEGNPLQYHFKNDGHWNEKGHLKAAQIIAKLLSKK